MKTNIIKYYKELFGLDEKLLKNSLNKTQNLIKDRLNLENHINLHWIAAIVIFILIILSFILSLKFFLPILTVGSIINLIVWLNLFSKRKEYSSLWKLNQIETNNKNTLFLLNKLNNLKEFLEEFKTDDTGLDKGKIQDILNLLKKVISFKLISNQEEAPEWNLNLLKEIVSNSDYLILEKFIKELNSSLKNYKKGKKEKEFFINYIQLTSLLTLNNSYDKIPENIFIGDSLENDNKLTKDKEEFLNWIYKILNKFNLKEQNLIKSCYNFTNSTFYLNNLLLFKLNNEKLNYNTPEIEDENYDFLILEDDENNDKDLIENILKEDILSEKEKEIVEKRLNRNKEDKNKEFSLKENLYI